MNDGEAMLRGILAGKGSAHALADWVIEQIEHRPWSEPPITTTTMQPIILFSDRHLCAHVRMSHRGDFGVWVRMNLTWGLTHERERYSPLIWLDPQNAESVGLLLSEIQSVFQFRSQK